MVLTKIVKFGDINPSSHYYFEKAVNDNLCDLERAGGFIMNVRMERYPVGDVAFFYAYILYNNKRNGIEKVENHQKPVMVEPEKREMTYHGADMWEAPVELKEIFERLMQGKDVSNVEIKSLDEYAVDVKLGNLTGK